MPRWSQRAGAGKRVPPVEEHGNGGVVKQRPRDDEEVEDLVAVPGEVERPGLPPLGHAAGVHPRAGAVRRSHERLQGQHDAARGVPPVLRRGVHGRHHAGEAHGEEEQRAGLAVLGRVQDGAEEGAGGEEGQEGDGGEVEEPGEGLAQEGVVYGREEGGDDHEGDARVVQAPEEVVEAAGVAGQQVGDAAAAQAHQRARHEHRPRPSRRRPFHGGFLLRRRVLPSNKTGRRKACLPAIAMDHRLHKYHTQLPTPTFESKSMRNVGSWRWASCRCSLLNRCMFINHMHAFI